MQYGRVAIALSAAAIVAIALYFWEFRQPIINPDDPAQVALGQRIYAGYCASCHGKNLEGEPSWPERKSNGRLPASPLGCSALSPRTRAICQHLTVGYQKPKLRRS
jgi:hypothetical protein